MPNMCTETQTHTLLCRSSTDKCHSLCVFLFDLSLSHTQLQWCMATLQYLSVSAFRYKYTKAWILKRAVGMTNSGSLVKGTLAPSPPFSGHVISLSKRMCCSKCLQRAIHQSDRPPTENTDSSQGGFGGINKHTQDCRKKCFNILQQKKKRKKAHLKNEILHNRTCTRTPISLRCRGRSEGTCARIFDLVSALNTFIFVSPAKLQNLHFTCCV